MKDNKAALHRVRETSPRGAVLAILGAVTLGVAVLSVAVSYEILEPRFGAWAVPTVGALDALWVVFQVTEILARNNRARVRRVQAAGLALTFVNAAIPTAELVLSRLDDGFDLAVVLTPIAIIMTKTAWWIALPSLGRPVSAATRRRIEERRQEVADRLEEMEAQASDRIELLELATELDQRIAQAETAYRKAMLKTQQTMTERLHKQAEATAQTVSEMALPAEVAAICLPDLDGWTPAAPALPGTPNGTALEGRHGPVTQVSALPQPGGTPTGAPSVTRDGTPAHSEPQAVTLAQLAAVASVPVPQPGEPLTDGQLDVVLRHLRYRDDPPLSYRQARDHFRDSGYVGSEARVRRSWAALMSNEQTSPEPEPADSSKDRASQDAETDTEDEPEDADADAGA
ncbi:hypothetical protein BJP40_05985 [Streptomyces sp. CC53]|uniref:hypothetical protein n=1 Tax=Streptomyces sp. CC53 TaxID=1906740 RepID=UPI0008DDCA35|nr:hypothetical protein [Streptomyces sp. CC53]OII61320.1 hypothetical protein BJP40_05985 [Streptomyces sp. CC53]